MHLIALSVTEKISKESPGNGAKLTLCRKSVKRSREVFDATSVFSSKRTRRSCSMNKLNTVMLENTLEALSCSCIMIVYKYRVSGTSYASRLDRRTLANVRGHPYRWTEQLTELHMLQSSLKSESNYCSTRQIVAKRVKTSDLLDQTHCQRDEIKAHQGAHLLISLLSNARPHLVLPSKQLDHANHIQSCSSTVRLT